MVLLKPVIPALGKLYRKYEGQNIFVTGEETFDMIAGKLYAVALAYDDLTKEFYPDYEIRSDTLFAIWECYHENGKHRSLL